MFSFVSVSEECFPLRMALLSICIMARKRYCHLVGVQSVTFRAPPPDPSTLFLLLKFKLRGSSEYSVLPSVRIQVDFRSPSHSLKTCSCKSQRGRFVYTKQSLWNRYRELDLLSRGSSLQQSNEVGTCIPTYKWGNQGSEGLSNLTQLCSRPPR